MAPLPADPATAVVKITNGFVVINNRPILRDINFCVTPGEVVAIVGANGSGKTTLLRTALGLRSLTRGSVELFGTPIDQFHAWHHVGYVPQRAALTSTIPATVKEVVSTGRLAHRRWWKRLTRQDHGIIATALETVGMAEQAEEPMNTLSGGQQQRVLIARALALQPQVLFLDEPNAGVDLVSQRAIADTLQRLTTLGLTIVTVLHELGPLADLAHRAIVIQEGRISFDGPIEHLPGQYRFGSQPLPVSEAPPTPLPQAPLTSREQPWS